MDIVSSISTSWRELFLERAPIDTILKAMRADEIWLQDSFQTDFVQLVLQYEQYPPHPSWFKHLLKCLVRELEKECDKGLEDSFAELAVRASLISVNSSDAIPFYVIYRLHASQPLPFRLLKGHNQVGTMVWTAGKYLCGFLHLHGRITQGKRVLELGSGTGVVGVSIATDPSTQPQTCVMTDFHDEVLANLRHNVEINEEHIPQSILDVKRLDWRAFEASSYHDSIDVVLAADCTYAADIVSDLLLALSKLLPDVSREQKEYSIAELVEKLYTAPKVAIVAATVRNPDTYAGFISGLDSGRFWHVELPREVIVAQGLESRYAALGSELDIRIVCIFGKYGQQ